MVEAKSENTAATTPEDCRLPEAEDAWDPTKVLQYTMLVVQDADEAEVLTLVNEAIRRTWAKKDGTL